MATMTTITMAEEWVAWEVWAEWEECLEWEAWEVVWAVAWVAE